MPTWPVTLPDDMLVGTYQETFPELVIRTKMSEGPDKVRKRFTTNITPISGQMLLTATQATAFKTFFEDECASGATAFTWTNPRTGAAASFRFVGQPKLVNESLYFRVELSLELMP